MSTPPPLYVMVIGGLIVTWVLSFVAVLRTKENDAFMYPLVISLVVALGYGGCYTEKGAEFRKELGVNIREQQQSQTPTKAEASGTAPTAEEVYAKESQKK